MVKVIAIDMDGTLLNSYGQLTEENTEAIREAQRQGIHVLIATGRNYDGVKGMLQPSGLKCSSICMSGVCICDEEGNTSVALTMAHDQVKKALEVFQEYDVYSDIMTSDGIYTLASRQEAEALYDKFMAVFHGLTPEAKVTRIQELIDRLHFAGSPEELTAAGRVVYKIVGFDPHTGTIDQLKKQLSVYEDLAVVSSFADNVEITDIKAQKGSALQAYIEQNGIQPEEVMAIGDSENDYSMLSMDFGYTVAMGNASDEIKAAAKYETKSNDENGVAWAIRKWAL